MKTYVLVAIVCPLDIKKRVLIVIVRPQASTKAEILTAQ